MSHLHAFLEIEFSKNDVSDSEFGKSFDSEYAKKQRNQIGF